MNYENTVCQYCRYRNSWDCDENYHPKEGCDSWALDEYTLTDKQKKHIKNALLIKLMDEEE